MSKFTLMLFVFLTPFYFILLLYIVMDPFKVIYSYSDYYANNFVPLNRDYVSTETFLNQYKKQKYNSFIFGSSRTVAYKTSDWQNFLNEKAIPFKFDAAEETIGGISAKLKLIDSLGYSIDNALIILCKDATFYDHSTTAYHLVEKHPTLTGKSSLAFQLRFLHAFLSQRFFIMYIDYSLFKQYRNYMHGYLQPNVLAVNSMSNDMFMISENKIINDSTTYYKKLKYEFRPEKFNSDFYKLPNLINRKHLVYLQEIKKILDKHQTNYKIVISPLYHQNPMDTTNINILTGIFGQDHVFDFSDNNKITENKYNYWESSHYRYRVGKQIMKEIYQNENTPNN